MALRTHRAALAALPVALVATLLGGWGSSSHPEGGVHAAPTTTSPAATAPSASVDRALARVERRYHAHLGLFMVDTGTGRTVAYHADDRFAFCSTSKLLTAGLVLRRASNKRLATTIHFTAAELQDYSPITSQHVDDGMSLRSIIAAALDYSDNTAANLLFKQLGGPSDAQKMLRGLGDTTTDMDRIEPDLNEAVPGDLRDTTTPRALAADLRRFALGDGLTRGRRAELDHWLRANTTGGSYIRAGVPDDWKVGDKTGSGGYGTRNDIAVLRPPHHAPVVLAILSDRHTKDAESDDALIADATRVVSRHLP